MAKQDETNTPTARSRIGRFQISIWKRKRVLPAKNDFDIEREVEMARACIRHGRFNRATQSWDNQTIWCNPDELRDLVNALDKLSQDSGGENAASREPSDEVDCDLMSALAAYDTPSTARPPHQYAPEPCRAYRPIFPELAAPIGGPYPR